MEGKFPARSPFSFPLLQGIITSTVCLYLAIQRDTSGSDYKAARRLLEICNTNAILEPLPALFKELFMNLEQVINFGINTEAKETFERCLETCRMYLES